MEKKSENQKLEYFHERTQFHELLLANPNYFGNLKKSDFKPVLNIAANVFYEQLANVSYNPATQSLEADVLIKQASGYSGTLCSDGSLEYVRFYLDYGAGWVDQGYTGINVHDIPTGKDCINEGEKPLSYVATLHIDPKKAFCKTHVLPKARAVLSWNIIPTANDPAYAPIWGNTLDAHIQISPLLLLLSETVDETLLNKILSIAAINPQLSLSQIAGLVPQGNQAIAGLASKLNTQPLDIASLSKLYAGQSAEVSPARFGTSFIQETLGADPLAISQNINVWKGLGLNWADIIGIIEKTNADTSYEILESAGLDYNQENLVASFRVKRKQGYSGDLCTAGSYEYIAFWADWNNDCKWQYLGTSSVNVHDFNDLPTDGLCYAALLPYDFTYHRKQCVSPYVVKIRAVLSWSTPPSTTDPDLLETWGNRLDTYIQIRPGDVIQPGQVEPIFNILGGIPVDHIDNSTGLTTAGAKFALNQVAVETGSPFGGIVVIQGPSFPGYKYRIRVTDLADGSFYYISNDLVLVGFLPGPPFVQYTTVVPDPINHYYDYQTFDKNTDNVLARWSPGTDDLLELSLEIFSVSGSFVKRIQMDNTWPAVALTVNDGGTCSYYKKGDT
ncbi:MAG TPA: hypothetical protein VMI35_09755, partial [Puia sp.]|nr:hypothetical protein [Puia sp.]